MNKENKISNDKTNTETNMLYIDVDRLAFPQEIAHIIGLSKERINWMKRQGCRFYRRKTCIRWVREFINEQAVAA
jgi:hypothetical protein